MSVSDDFKVRMAGSVILFALREGGKKAAEEKVLKYIEGKTGDEIQKMSLQWPDEVNKALAEFLSNDERFR